MYSQLKDSYQWNMLNQDGRVINKVQKLISSGESITFDRMPTALSVLRNRTKTPILNNLLDAIKNESIVLVLSEDKTPNFLPFVVMQTSKFDYRVVVFLDLCEAKLGEINEVLVNERKLKVALETAYFTLQLLDDRNKAKLQSASIVRPSAKMYAYIISECINRKHSIKMDQNVFNAIIYLMSKFFIRTTLGCTSNDDVVETYCMGNCQKPYPESVHNITDKFEDKDFEDISTIITKMASDKDLVMRIGKLTVSNFTELYINMYDSAMLLAMENFPYFIFNVLSVVNSTYVNNQYQLKNIVGDDGGKLYATLLSTLC